MQQRLIRLMLINRFNLKSPDLSISLNLCILIIRMLSLGLIGIGNFAEVERGSEDCF